MNTVIFDFVKLKTKAERMRFFKAVKDKFYGASRDKVLLRIAGKDVYAEVEAESGRGIYITLENCDPDADCTEIMFPLMWKFINRKEDEAYDIFSEYFGGSFPWISFRDDETMFNSFKWLIENYVEYAKNNSVVIDGETTSLLNVYKYNNKLVLRKEDSAVHNCQIYPKSHYELYDNELYPSGSFITTVSGTRMPVTKVFTFSLPYYNAAGNIRDGFGVEYHERKVDDDAYMIYMIPTANRIMSVRLREALLDFSRSINDLIDPCPDGGYLDLRKVIYWLCSKNVTAKDGLRNVDYIAKEKSFTFLPEGKESVVADDNFHWKKNNRQSSKPGKLLRKMFMQYNVNLGDKIIEDMAHYVAAYFEIPELTVVSGKDIAKYYHKNCYHPSTNNNTLGKSCMREESKQSYLRLYTDNPERVSMVLMFDKHDKDYIIGRALLWKVDDKITLMDRVYGSERVQSQFARWAAEKSYWRKFAQTHDSATNFVDDKGNVVRNKTMAIKGLRMNPYWFYPYIDTFYFVRPELGIIGNSSEVGSKYGLKFYMARYYQTGSLGDYYKIHQNKLGMPTLNGYTMEAGITHDESIWFVGDQLSNRAVKTVEGIFTARELVFNSNGKYFYYASKQVSILDNNLKLSLYVLDVEGRKREFNKVITVISRGARNYFKVISDNHEVIKYQVEAMKQYAKYLFHDDNVIVLPPVDNAVMSPEWAEMLKHFQEHAGEPILDTGTETITSHNMPYNITTI